MCDQAGLEEQLIGELGAVKRDMGISMPPNWPSSESVKTGHLEVTKDWDNHSHNAESTLFFSKDKQDH